MRPARPPLVDVLVAAAFVLLVAAEALLSSEVASPALHLTVAGGAMVSLAWRRSWPVLVAAVVMTSNLTVNPEGQFSTLLAMVLVSFTCGSECDPPWSWIGLAVVVTPFLGSLALEGLEPSDVAAALVFLVGPWTVGVAMRRRAARATEAEERAHRLEQEREEHAMAAAAAERTRIARELHDIVSHSLSVITIQAQAVRRRLGPEQVCEAEDLAAVESTARDALAEMRRLFGVLRSDGESASLSPQPGLAELDRLCDQVRASGLAVDVRTDGLPRTLPPGLDLAAYRIVQEGLTNALRHSGARRANVTLTYDAGRLDIAVEDDGRGFDPATDTAEGHGLVGVRERVALYAGTLRVVPGEQRGTRLVASLPLKETP
ncbi:sensor histidine kinase [Nocardioides piscis]|uniref:histidine kinase n=1 Tax=Nocardioides piscis TaxID=2714938 RepID=A0A6G7YFL0_9ACTN|nr:sensor histidine kinase [Nocardioides piscis]QIK75431.1 sensor histidine kinase [Nocardioides piscis]